MLILSYMKIKLFSLLLITSIAGATEPVISSLLPREAKPGYAGNCNHRTATQRLEEIFFYTDGISAENIVVEKGKKLTASFTIAKEAKIGQHELRLRTKQGVSRLFTFGSVLP